MSKQESKKRYVLNPTFNDVAGYHSLFCKLNLDYLEKTYFLQFFL